jgi:hypothetical protein
MARAIPGLLGVVPGDHATEVRAGRGPLVCDAQRVDVHGDAREASAQHRPLACWNVLDARDVGAHWLRKVRRMIDRSIAVRDSIAVSNPWHGFSMC